LLLPIILFNSCYNEVSYFPQYKNPQSILFIDEKPVLASKDSNFVLATIESFGNNALRISHDEKSYIYINGIEIKNDTEFDFGTIDKNSKYTIRQFIPDGIDQTYTLQFTTLPIIHIEYNYAKVPDEPKAPAKFILIDPAQKGAIIENCGIETRGRYMLNMKKKSYGIEIRQSEDIDDNKNISLLGMYNDDDWILDAAYPDSSRMRNNVLYSLWGNFQENAQHRAYNSMSSGINSRFTEIFINNQYVGLYCLSERIEAKMLGIKKEQTGKQGYLYKAEDWTNTTRMTDAADTLNVQDKWEGWEQKYPKRENGLIWKPLYEFIDFVANSDDDTFAQNIANKICIDQAIDYLIFVNFIYSWDNLGNNIILAKYSPDDPFFIIPWDLNASMGRNWEGYEENATTYIQSNLYERLSFTNPHNYRMLTKKRYFELREDALQYEAIEKRFTDNANILKTSGALDRENIRWPLSPVYIDKEINYILNWTQKRLEFLDMWYENY
jgi:hypothetical protein